MARSYAFCGNKRFIEEVGPRLAEAGFARVEEPASADVVITYCSSQTALEDLYFGDDGVVEQAAPGSLVIDLSPMTPSFAREVNAVATVSDLVMVEAPLVVADMVADSVYGRGNLSCFVACGATATRASPRSSTCSSRPFTRWALPATRSSRAPPTPFRSPRR